MIVPEIEREYEDLGGVNFFRVVVVEDEGRELYATAFKDLATAKYPHLHFDLASFEDRENAAKHLANLRKRGNNVHLLIVDQRLGGDKTGGTRFVTDALRCHPDAFFCLSTGWLEEAWGQLAGVDATLRQKILRNQVHPYVKGEHHDRIDYTVQIEHFLSLYRALIAERRRKPAIRLVLTNRKTLRYSDNGVFMRHPWLVRQVVQPSNECTFGCYTDDPLVEGDESFDEAVVIVTKKSLPNRRFTDAAIRTTDRTSDMQHTYVSRKHYRCFGYVPSGQRCRLRFARAPIKSASDDKHALIANLNFIWLDEAQQKSPIQPLIAKTKVDYQPPRRQRKRESTQEYDFQINPDLGAVERLKSDLPILSGDSYCTYFGCLAHLYCYYNARQFFLREDGSEADETSARGLAAALARGASGLRLRIGEIARLVIDDVDTPVPLNAKVTTSRPGAAASPVQAQISPKPPAPPPAPSPGALARASVPKSSKSSTASKLKKRASGEKVKAAAKGRR